MNTTDFGTIKTEKLIGIRFNHFNDTLINGIADMLSNDYSTAVAVDMSRNSNIIKYGPNTVLDWSFELEGFKVQVGVKKRIVVRSAETLNAMLIGKPITPRVSWYNDIQEYLVVRTEYKWLVYLVTNGKFLPLGMLDSVFNSLKAAKIEHSLKKLNPGEGMLYDYSPRRKGLTPKEAVSVFVKDQNFPENVVHDIARLCAVV